MIKRIYLLLSLFICCVPTTIWAQDIVVTDTLQLAVTSMEDEPDPNNQEYIFSLFGTSGTKSYKIQIDYHSATMLGTFTDADFDLAGDGKNHNFIRTSDGMNFWLFKHLDVTVRDSLGATIVEVNGLIQNFSQWRRVLAKGIIEAPAPSDTLDIDLGLATIIPMNQLGYEYLRIDAANTDYSLAFGIVGHSTLQAGTYYRAQLLRPDLVLLPQDTILAANATLIVTDAEQGYHNLELTLLGTDNILYRVAMHTGLIEATDTVQVVCQTGLIQNLTDMYGIYQIAGVSNDYQVAIALTPGVIEESLLAFTSDSVNLAYTRLLDVAANEMIYVMHASGYFVPDSTAFLPCMLVHADLLGINGTLYQVTLPVGGSQLPVAADTTVVECGNYVGRIDYTHGAGFMGLVIGNEQHDVHVTVYNGLSMQGTFSSDMFVYDDPASFVTSYKANGLFSFDDVAAAEMRMDSIQDTVRIELNVVTVNSHMYCFHANLLPTRALTGEEVAYGINNTFKQDGMLVAFRLDKQGNTGLYNMQVQRADAWDEETGDLAGENFEVWNFIFAQDSVDGISGTYSYGAGTLMEDESAYHTIMEHGTEIWLMPMAGTLRLIPTQRLTIPASVLGFDYHTHVYHIEAHIVMENGVLYHVEGDNYLLCMDYQTEQLVELTEEVLTALDDVLGEQGLRVKKVLRNGMILLESTDHTYTISGQIIQ